MAHHDIRKEVWHVAMILPLFGFGKFWGKRSTERNTRCFLKKKHLVLFSYWYLKAWLFSSRFCFILFTFTIFYCTFCFVFHRFTRIKKTFFFFFTKTVDNLIFFFLHFKKKYFTPKKTKFYFFFTLLLLLPQQFCSKILFKKRHHWKLVSRLVEKF